MQITRVSKGKQLTLGEIEPKQEELELFFLTWCLGAMPVQLKFCRSLLMKFALKENGLRFSPSFSYYYSDSPNEALDWCKE